MQHYASPIFMAFAISLFFNAVVANGKSTTTPKTTTDENDNNRGVIIIDDELVGCCESFGYGEYMVKCCFDYQDNVKQSACLRHKLGGGQRHYANKQCSAVKQEKEEISEPLTRKISTATTKTTSFQAYVSYSISTATMDENDKNRAVSITDDEPSVSAVPIKATLAMHDRDSNRGGTDTDDDELVGCCEYFGYGSFMVKCCFRYQDNVKQSACLREVLGGGRRHHANKQCSTVKQEKEEISEPLTQRISATTTSSFQAYVPDSTTKTTIDEKQEKAVSKSSSLLPAMTLFIFCFMPYFV